MWAEKNLSTDHLFIVLASIVQVLYEIDCCSSVGGEIKKNVGKDPGPDKFVRLCIFSVHCLPLFSSPQIYFIGNGTLRLKINIAHIQG